MIEVQEAAPVRVVPIPGRARDWLLPALAERSPASRPRRLAVRLRHR